MPEYNGNGNGSAVANTAGCGGCASANERCGNGLEKIYPTTAVRFGRMNHIGEFTHPPDMKFTCGAKVVIAGERGIEIGEQVSLTCFGCEKSVDRDQMRSYAETSGGDTYRLKSGKILREATPSDLNEWQHIQDQVSEKLAICRRMVAEFGLDMKIVDCEHVFGGERVVFYFMAEERIDFRELVRRLASEFQTRIEMRQIGARDEARLLADVETCGRECCCKNFLKTLKPISMSMAKLQKTTLDIAKVSGRCGRLKCCLRYEHESYQEMSKNLPRIGMRIHTNHGTGRVVDRQILTQLVKIHSDEGKYITVVAEDIVEWNVPEGAPAREAPPERPERRRSSESDAKNRTSEKTDDTEESSSRTSRRSRRSRGRSSSGASPPEPASTDENAVETEADSAETPAIDTAKDVPPPSGPASGSADRSETERSSETPSASNDQRKRSRRRKRRRPRGGGRGNRSS